VKQGRVNFTTLTDLPEGAPIMTGLFVINNRPAVILFDSGASHSFISTRYAARNGIPYVHTTQPYMISTPGGKIGSDQVVRQVSLILGSTIFTTDLITLGLQGIDVILGMNWMTQHGVLLDIPS
jgi:predicted aspartyl protease